MLWGENREKWKGQQFPGIEPMTHSWLVQPVLSHWTTLTGQLPAPTISSICIVGEMPQSHTDRQPLSMCHWSSIRSHWQLENSRHQQRTHADCFFSLWMFIFLPQHEREWLGIGSLLMERIFQFEVPEFRQHILSGCRVCDCSRHFTCEVHAYRGLWGLVVVWLS